MGSSWPSAKTVALMPHKQLASKVIAILIFMVRLQASVLRPHARQYRLPISSSPIIYHRYCTEVSAAAVLKKIASPNFVIFLPVLFLEMPHLHRANRVPMVSPYMYEMLQAPQDFRQKWHRQVSIPHWQQGICEICTQPAQHL